MIENIKEVDLEKKLKGWNRFFEKEKQEVIQIHEQLLNQCKEASTTYRELSEQQTNLHREITELKQAVAASKNELTNARKQFDAMTNEEVLHIFEKTHQLQTELILLEQKYYVLSDEKNTFQRSLKEWEQQATFAGKLRQKITIVSKYMLNDYCTEAKMGSIQNSQSIGLKILEAQENEKRRISREIHDGPAQMLANMLMQYEFIDQSFLNGNSEAALKEVKTLRMNIKETLAEIRQIIFDLRPMILDDLGLVPTLNRQIAEMERQAKIPIYLKVDGFEDRIEPNMEVTIFRLIQESVQNAVTHAQAKRIHVSLTMLAHHINVMIEDDGIGFTLDESTINNGSFGLIGMKERIELMRGEMGINSKKGIGTIIKMKIPI